MMDDMKYLVRKCNLVYFVSVLVMIASDSLLMKSIRSNDLTLWMLPLVNHNP